MGRRAIKGLAWLALAWLVLAAVPAALGQSPKDAVFRGGGGGKLPVPGPGPAPILLLKIVGFVLLAVAAFVLAFYWWYPQMLDRPASATRPRPRPRAAYGHAWACVLAGTSVAFLAVFWYDLVLTQLLPVQKVPDLVNHWSLKIAVLLTAVVSFVAVSSHYKSTPRAAGPGR